MMKEIKGNIISPGFAMGFILKLEKDDGTVKPKIVLTENDIKEEIKRLEVAFDRAKYYITSLIENVKKLKLGDKVGIFEMQLLLVDDSSTVEKCSKIIKELNTAYDAIDIVFEDLAKRTRNKKNSYLASRADDILDLKNTLLRGLKEDIKAVEISDESILCMDELLPSHTMSLDLNKVKAFVVQNASVTGHASIISKTLKIPLLQVDRGDIESLKNGDYVIVSGKDSSLILDPDEETKKKFLDIISEEKIKTERLKLLKGTSSETRNGQKVELLANIGTEQDSTKVKDNQGEGVGLFRSEFLFLDSNSEPSEEEQFRVIKRIVENVAPYPVTIRSLDIGGDKEIPYLNIKKEDNAFLGVRGMRLYREKKELTLSHFRAIIRQTEYHKIKLMIPMISVLEEIIHIKEYIKTIFTQLKIEGYKVKEENLVFGIMVETPSAALMSNKFAEEVEFFSIGSNDLTQYTLAVDRVNGKLNYLYSNLHPSILKLIHACVLSCMNHKKTLSVCGEMAGTPEGSIALLALGIRTLSMNSNFIPEIKNIILNLDTEKMHGLRENILEKCRTSAEVLDEINKFRRNNGII